MSDYTLYRIGVSGKSENLSFTGTSAQSSAIPSGIRAIRLVSNQDVYFVIGQNPTATTSGVFLPAGVVEYVVIQPNEKIAAIQSSVSGTLNISYATR